MPRNQDVEKTANLTMSVVNKAKQFKNKKEDDTN